MEARRIFRMPRYLALGLLFACYCLCFSRSVLAIVIIDQAYSILSTEQAVGYPTGLFLGSDGTLNYSVSSFNSPGLGGVYRLRDDGTSERWSDADGFDATAALDGTAYLVGRSVFRNLTRVNADGAATELVSSSAGLHWLYVTPAPDSSFIYANTTSQLFSVDPISGARTAVATAGLSGFLDGAFASSGAYYFAVGNTPSNSAGIYRLDADGPTLLAPMPIPGISPFSLAADPEGGLWYVTAYSAKNALYHVDAMGLTSLIADELLFGDAQVAFDPNTGILATAGQGPEGPLTLFRTPFTQGMIPEPPTVAVVILGLVALAIVRRSFPRSCQRQSRASALVGFLPLPSRATP